MVVQVFLTEINMAREKVLIVFLKARFVVRSTRNPRPSLFVLLEIMCWVAFRAGLSWLFDWLLAVFISG